MTSAAQADVALASVSTVSILLIFVFRGVTSYHINNEMIQQGRGPDRPGKPETSTEARQDLAAYLKEYPTSNLRKAQKTLMRKAQKTLIWSSSCGWVALIGVLLMVWHILANQ